jgi:hypothetical protein
MTAMTPAKFLILRRAALTDETLDGIFKALEDRGILLGACKAAVTMFTPKKDSLLPDDVKALIARSFQNDPVCQQLIAAITEAEEQVQ